MLRRPFRRASGLDAALRAYERRRPAADRTSICNAPLTNLYLRADGAVAPCWLQFHVDSPRWSPDGPGLHEIWTGEQLRGLRVRLAERHFEGPCTTCRGEIEVGNLPLAAAYDELPIDPLWPTMFEVELSNQCNLECVMCSGMLSSRIRANREKLPPLEVPYDEAFIDELSEFLPHLHELRINGGEPFLQALAFTLLDRVAEIAPDLKVTVATNGTVLNSKVERALSQCNLHLNVSVDSLVGERYEEIRVHARFDVLMRNLERFIDQHHRDGRLLCIMVNPMRANWDEMAEYVRWCNERDVALWFNTIRYPEHLALHSLPRGELEAIRSQLAGESLPAPAGRWSWLHQRNIAVFERFRDVQLRAWIEAAGAEPRAAAVPVSLRARAGDRPTGP